MARVYGPERFFYDQSTFTGVHRHGGPDTLDGGNVQLHLHLDRSPADVRGVKIHAVDRSSSGRSWLRSASGRELGFVPVRTASGREFVRAGSVKSLSRSGSSRSVSRSEAAPAAESPIPLPRTDSGWLAASLPPEPSLDELKAVYGPQRFYYDTDTFTGVHKHGGPSLFEGSNVQAYNHVDRSPADVRGVRLQSRPGTGSNRPGTGSSRPGTGSTRPGTGSRPGTSQSGASTAKLAKFRGGSSRILADQQWSLAALPLTAPAHTHALQQSGADSLQRSRSERLLYPPARTASGKSLVMRREQWLEAVLPRTRSSDRFLTPASRAAAAEERKAQEEEERRGFEEEQRA